MQKVLNIVLVTVILQACNHVTGKRDGKSPSDDSSQDAPQTVHGWSTIPEAGAPSPRYRPTVLQQGSKIIIYGGYGESSELSDGAVYDLQTNSWAPIPSHGQKRSMNSVGLAGDYLIVWGGDNRDNWRSVSGVKFKIGSDHWEPVSTIEAPSPRYLTPAFSMGEKLLIWGGHPNCDIVDGKIYDPVADTWRSVPAAPIGITAGCDNVYFDKNKLLVWGHYTEERESPFSNGAIYNAESNSWETIALDGQPSEREFPLLLANEKYIAVWGGRTRYREGAPQKELSDGGIYDIANKKWNLISDDSGKIPGGAQPTGLVLNDHSIFVWGGSAFGIAASNHGGTLDLGTGKWQLASEANVPNARSSHFMRTIDDHKTLVFGGFNGSQGKFDGSIYDSSDDRWTAIEENHNLPPRNYAAIHWTGEKDKSLFVWGGNKIEQNQTILVPGGGIWRP